MSKPAYMVEVSSQIYYVVKWKRSIFNRLYALRRGDGHGVYIGSKRDCLEELERIIVQNNVFNRNRYTGLSCGEIKHGRK